VVVPDVAYGRADLVVSNAAGPSSSYTFTVTAPTIPITVYPKVIQPANGKLPTSVDLAVFESNCDDKAATDLANGPNGPYTIMVTGSGIKPDPKSSPKANKCTVTVALTIDPNAPAQDYKVILNDRAGNPVGSANMAVLDSSAGPIPPGLNPQVDVMWEVMSQKNCADAFGRRVAISLYCIQVKLGNNTGHALQIAGIGFSKKNVDLLTDLGIPSVTIANSSYGSTRAVLVHEQPISVRNLGYNALQGAGLVMSAATPFFAGTTNSASTTAAKLRFTTISSIANGPLLAAYNLIFPDPILKQLNNLDDQSFRDNAVIQNNSQIQTIVFVEKEALVQSLEDMQFHMIKELKERHGDSSRNNNCDKLCGMIRTDFQQTIKNSERKSFGSHFSLGPQHSPLLVKLALGDLVIVGDEIDFLQRVQIQSNAASTSALSPLTASPPSLAFADQMVAQPSNPQKVTLTNTGSSAITSLAFQLSNKSEFSIPSDSNTCTSNLAPSTPCSVSVTFTPDPTQGLSAARSAILNISFSPGSSPLPIQLSGNAKTPATPTVVFSQTALAFGAQKAGSGQSTATLTIVNFMGGQLTSLAISPPAGANSVDFPLPSDNKCATTLDSEANCSVTWTFKPVAGTLGPRTATVQVGYSIGGVAKPPQSISLNGTAQ